MSDIHMRLGELLVVVYLAIAIGSFLLARRNGLPTWVTATAHALLGVQIIFGIIIYARNTDIMPLSHVIVGLLTLPALALVVPLRPRMGRARAVAVTSLVVFVLAAIAMGIGMSR